MIDPAPLSALHIGNFKAFGDTQTIPIKPITLIFGPNSAGKSSIIHSLIFAHEAATQYRGKSDPLDVHTTVLGGHSVELGGFDNFIHRSSSTAAAATEVEWGLDFPVSVARILTPLLPDTKTISVRIRFGRVNKNILGAYNVEYDDEERPSSISRDVAFTFEKLTVSSVEIRLDGVAFCRFGISIQPEEPWDHESATLISTSLDLAHPAVSVLLDRAISPALSRDFGMGLHLINYSHALLDFELRDTCDDLDYLEEREKKLSTQLRQCIKKVLASAKNVISRVHYLGPLRQVPDRLLILPNEAESISNANGMRSYRELLRNPNLVKDVSTWLEKLDFGYTLELEDLIRSSKLEEELKARSPESIERQFKARRSGEKIAREAARVRKLNAIPLLILRDKRSGIEVSMKDVGAGVAQALPVICSLVSAKNSVVAIEQPELHLHPRLQAELGDLFIEAAGKNNAIIAETHSEHLILRILRRIRETTDDKLPKGMRPLRADDVCVLYVQPGESGSTVMQLEITSDGDFVQRWPNGFFADRLKELF